MTWRLIRYFITGLIITLLFNRHEKRKEQKAQSVKSAVMALLNCNFAMPAIETNKNETLTETIDILKSLAEEGNASAQYKLGLHYKEGLGVPKHFTEAINWISKAARQKHVDAMALLGMCYLIGYGVQKDLHRARGLLHSASQKEHLEAQQLLNKLTFPRRRIVRIPGL